MKNLLKIAGFGIICFFNTLAKPPIYISLGSVCEAALCLRTLNLRSEAYPFDWLITTFQALMHALETDFEFMLENLTLRNDKYGVIDYYGINYIHDWPTVVNSTIDALNVDSVSNKILLPGWESTIPLVKEKYRRRIRRFHEVCSGSNKVYFIRSRSITKEQAIILRDYFIRKYPNLDFELLVLRHDESFVEPWRLDRIRNYFISPGLEADVLGRILQELINQKRDEDYDENHN